MNSLPREVAGAQLLDRAVAILQAVRDAGSGGASTSTLMSSLKLKQSTAHRILSSLEAHGLVDRDRQSKRYRIGATIVALATDATDLMVIQEASRPALARLSVVTGETSFVALPFGLNTICVECRTGDGRHATAWPLPGGLGPMGLDAAGQALLAFMPAEQAELVLRANAHLFGLAGSLDEDRIRRRIDDGRRLKYIFSPQTKAHGQSELATPILAKSGFAVGALALLAPSGRLSKDGLSIMTSLLIDEARQISDRLERFGRSILG